MGSFCIHPTLSSQTVLSLLAGARSSLAVCGVEVCGLTALGSSTRAKPFAKKHSLWFRASARAVHSHPCLYPPHSCALAAFLHCSCGSGFPGKKGSVAPTTHPSGRGGAWEAMKLISKTPGKEVSLSSDCLSVIAIGFSPTSLLSHLSVTCPHRRTEGWDC